MLQKTEGGFDYSTKDFYGVVYHFKYDIKSNEVYITTQERN